MQVDVEYQDDAVSLEVPEGRLVGSWRGPAGVSGESIAVLVDRAVGAPAQSPPLRSAVVPGDRVVLALGADVTEAGAVLAALCRVLESAGVGRESTSVLVEPGTRTDLASLVPAGLTAHLHDPADRPQLAYLASTSSGRRVYLNRLLTDADVVIPVGRLAYDPVLGHRGPWGVLFPGLSDTKSRDALRSLGPPGAPGSGDDVAGLDESREVSWLLGSQYQVGLVAGRSGVAEAVAGLPAEVLDRGVRSVDEAWDFRPESRAELVVVGIGRPGEPADVGGVARGLATASRLVQRGGKVVILSRARGPIGPAMSGLVGLDDPRMGERALRGREGEHDYLHALQVAKGLAWADVYLFSDLDHGDVEDLSMVPLDRPQEARRLVANAGSCLAVSQADLVRASVVGEAEEAEAGRPGSSLAPRRPGSHGK